jgi:DNA-directed RNA polymerase specialized sigma24 family protein
VRGRWTAIQESLADSIRTSQAEQTYRDVARRWPALQHFDGPGALVAYLRALGRSLREKNLVYRALVEMVQEGGAAGDLAVPLLWLGLGPALRNVVRRRRHLFQAEQDAVAEVNYRFLRLIRSLDLGKVSRIAATLVRGTDRDVRDFRMRALRTAGLHDELRQHHGVIQTDENQGVVRVQAWLEGVIGEDADLVLGVVLYGLSQIESGRRLGLSSSSARKRYQRAMAALRKRALVPFRGRRPAFAP